MAQSRTEITVGEGFKPSRSKMLRYLIVEWVLGVLGVLGVLYLSPHYYNCNISLIKIDSACCNKQQALSKIVFIK